MKQYNIDSLLENLENPTPEFLKEFNESFDTFIRYNYPELECKNFNSYNLKMTINGYTKLIERRQENSNVNPLKNSTDCYSYPQKNTQPIKVYNAQKEAA